MRDLNGSLREIKNSVYSNNTKMNLIEKLIGEVAKRPLLWDRYDDDYYNRSAMDTEWEKISMLLGKDKEYVKQKWRNLRDQFQRESKKVKVPFDNPTKPYITYYRGKWIYFEQMLFLKEVPLAKRVSSTHSPPQGVELREDEIKEEILVFEDDISEDQINYAYESDNYERSVTSPDEETEAQTENIPAQAEINETKNSEVNKVEDNLRKRKASDTVAASSVKHMKLSDNSTNTDVDVLEDDDLHFVKSLVPYLKKLTPIRKLLVRNEIHSLLIRESLCENCKIGKLP